MELAPGHDSNKTHTYSLNDTRNKSCFVYENHMLVHLQEYLPSQTRSILVWFSPARSKPSTNNMRAAYVHCQFPTF